jgi:hypothetical protein
LRQLDVIKRAGEGMERGRGGGGKGKGRGREGGGKGEGREREVGVIGSSLWFVC